jgi:threonylcarbamoyladenosine tRNA methylthiotransferase CDKAL1
LNEVKPDVVNISRFGVRPNTVAEKLPQIHDKIKKDRSRILSKLCSEISLQKNKKLEGSIEKIFVTEFGKNNAFIGRSSSYKPIVVSENFLGKFVLVKLEKAFPTYLTGSFLEAVFVQNQ